ncbi:MAG: hypothetical protein ACI9VR_004603 [Cognaticolwellia sp.]
MIPLLLTLLSVQPTPAPTPQATPPISVLEQRQVADRQLLICRTRAAEFKGFPEEELSVWDVCLREAKTRELTLAIPLIQGERALVELEQKSPGLAQRDPITHARAVLAIEASSPDVLLPISDLRVAWLLLISDPSSRQNLDAVRTVTVRVEDLQVDDADMVEELLRRHIGDMGFKVALPDDASAANSSIHFMVSGNQSASIRRTSRMDFHEITLNVSSGPIQYTSLKRQGSPLSAQGFSSPTLPDQAFREAADAASEGLAQAFLRQVVGELFSPGQDPL